MAMQMVKDLEGKMYEEWLKSRAEEAEGEVSWQPMAAYGFVRLGVEGQRPALISVTVTGPEGTAWRSQERGTWGLKTGSVSEGGGNGTGCSEMGMAPSARVKGVFGQCSQTYNLIFRWCCVEIGFGLSDPCWSFPT